jgi:hypothetical protein
MAALAKQRTCMRHLEELKGQVQLLQQRYVPMKIVNPSPAFVGNPLPQTAHTIFIGSGLCSGLLYLYPIFY